MLSRTVPSLASWFRRTKASQRNGSVVDKLEYAVRNCQPRLVIVGIRISTRGVQSQCHLGALSSNVPQNHQCSLCRRCLICGTAQSPDHRLAPALQPSSIVDHCVCSSVPPRLCPGHERSGRSRSVHFETATSGIEGRAAGRLLGRCPCWRQ